MSPYTDQFSLSSLDVYKYLTSKFSRITWDNATSMIDLAERFGEVRLPFEGVVLAVIYSEGYYSITFH